VQQQNSAIRKHFSVREANATLPLVSAIVRDLTELAREVVQRRERLSDLPRVGGADSDDPYGAEVAQVAEDLERDSHRLREYVEELLELGVKPRSVTQGVIDFPAMMDDRPVYLCWKLGEPEVLHWHEQGATFRDRRPLRDRQAQEQGRGSDVGSTAQ
jgi:hypothetical protein